MGKEAQRKTVYIPASFYPRKSMIPAALKLLSFEQRFCRRLSRSVGVASTSLRVNLNSDSKIYIIY